MHTRLLPWESRVCERGAAHKGLQKGLGKGGQAFGREEARKKQQGELSQQQSGELMIACPKLHPRFGS